MADAPIRVLIADDHAVVREGIRHVLNREHGFDVVGEACDGDEVVHLARQLRPDVIVLDISMPAQSGLEATQKICDRQSGARVLVLSIHEHEEYVARSMRAGARGYLRKDSAPAELREAVRSIHSGAEYFGRAIPGGDTDSSRADAAGAPLDTLTGREREVLVGVAQGMSNKEIAARFGISVRTVESHRDSLMRKLDLRGAAALTRFAIVNGLLSPSGRHGRDGS